MLMNSKANKAGLRKTAILLIALGPEVSAQILKQLPESMIQKITYEISNISYVEPYDKDKVVNEFIDMASARQYVLDGGIDYAKNLLNKALGVQRAKEVIDFLYQVKQKERPFSIVRKADPQQITNLLLNEHPQITALVLCYMHPDKAAMVLAQFPVDKQSEIAERLATINRTSPTVIKRIEKIMEDKFSGLLDNDVEAVGGVKTLVEILNSVDRSTEKNILDSLERSQPELAESVKANLFTFEDIITLDKGSIQRILRDLSNEDLALALKGASERLVNTVYSNMSTRASQMLKDDIQFMGPVRLQAVEEAQRKIVALIRKLDELGEIVITRGDQNDVLV